MKIFKEYVRNHAQPEGCIAKCYLLEECMRFCSGYVKQVAEVDVQGSRNHHYGNDLFREGDPTSKGTSITFADEMLQSAHRYVLLNRKEVEPYFE